MYYTTIVALGMLCISPILSLPFILWDIYRQHRSGLVLFALFLGIIAFLTPPVGDLYRHTKDYFNMEYYSFDALCHTLKDDFVTQIFSFFLQALHIKYPIARFVYTTIGFSIKFWIFNNIVSNKYSNRDYFLLFSFAFCSSGIFSFILGVRHGLASTFFFLGYYLFYEKNRHKTGLLSFLFASCIHFIFVPLSLCVILLHYIKFQINNKLFLFMAFVVGAFGLVMSAFVVKSIFVDHTDYLEGQWGTDYQASFKGWIFYWLSRVSVLPLFIFFLKNNKIKDSWNNVIFIFALIFIMTFNLVTISGRILGTLSGLLFYYYLRYNGYCSLKLEKIIIGTAFFMFICAIYTNRLLFTNQQISAYNEIWKPLPLILEHDYSKEWTYTHIDSNGYIKKKYE